MEALNSIRIFKALSDKSRLLIVNNLLKEPMYVELLAERLGLATSTVSFHLKKLEDAGIVKGAKEQYYIVYYINEEILNYKMKDLVRVDISEEEIAKKREEEYKQKVINSFFEYGKLISIPVQAKKRKIVYEQISKLFQEDIEYTEREVNIIIADINDDFCTIRKGMVDEKIFTRENGIYKLISSKNK